MIVGALATPVPIPGLPPEPADYSIHPVSVVLLIAMGVAMVIFAGVVLWYSWTGPRTGRPAPWRLIWWLVGIAVVTLAAGAIISQVGERRAEAAKQEYRETLGAAEAQVREQLEALYGVQWQYYSDVPMKDDDWEGGATELRLPDGTVQDCFVVTEDGHYSIRCGGDTAESSEPLARLSP